jgi:hypothetical protein
MSVDPNPIAANPNAGGTTSNPGPSNGGQSPAGPSTKPPVRRKVTWAAIKARQAREYARNRPVLHSVLANNVQMQSEEQQLEEGNGEEAEEGNGEAAEEGNGEEAEEGNGEEVEEGNGKGRQGRRIKAADFKALMEEVFATVVKKKGFSDLFEDDEDEGLSPRARRRTGKASNELREEKAKDKKWERKAFVVSKFSRCIRSRLMAV